MQIYKGFQACMGASKEISGLSQGSKSRLKVEDRWFNVYTVGVHRIWRAGHCP